MLSELYPTAFSNEEQNMNEKKISLTNKLFDKHYYIFTGILSVILNFTLELLADLSFTEAINHLCNNTYMFISNSAFLYLIFVVLSLTKKKYFALTLLSCLCLATGITNSFLMHYRHTPFIAADFFVIKSALDVMDVYMTKFQIVLAITGIIGSLTLMIIVFIKEKAKKIQFKKLCVAFFISLCATAIPLNMTSPDANAAQNKTLIDTAEKNGFLYCFINSIFTNGLDMPDEYNHWRIMSILNEIKPKKTNISDTEKPNIIAIQLESFIDPYLIEGTDYSENPIPNFTRLKQENTSGLLDVAVYGGGTANTEFEILTGMNVRYFGLGEYPFETVLQEQPIDSVAYNLSRNGYKTHAMHNHTGSFYNRNLVYPNLGFDTFTSSEYMNEIQYTYLGWEKSNVFTDLAFECMEQSEEKDFMFIVTSQCHGKYPTKHSRKQSIKVTECPDEIKEEKSEIEYFVNEMHDEDKWLGEFIDLLSDYKEPVIVVIYGDHFPSIRMPEAMQKDNRIYQPEYIIWSNYKEENNDIDLPAYRLMSSVLDKAGIHTGIFNKLHQYTINNNKDTKLMLKHLQYDLISGEQYAYELEGITCKPSKMQMGFKVIKINKIEKKGSKTVITGENFTKASKVFVDDDEVNTTYVNCNTLKISSKYSKTFSKISVCQTAPNGTVLSETKPFMMNY